MFTKFSRAISRFLVLSVSLVPCLYSQIDTGTIVGTVRDSSGAVAPNAKVTLRRVSTNETFNTVTNATGDYRVSPLPIGEYDISVELGGFKTDVKKGVKLEVGRTIRIDFALTLGEVSDKVEVTASIPLLNTEKAEVGHVFDNQKLLDLPLGTRDFENLATLSPGATPTRGQVHGGNVSGGLNVRGMRRGDNVISIDGGVYSSVDGFSTFIPNIDALGEFQIKTGLYGAEYGIRPGGQIIAVTKSGTNELHGSAFEFLRNDNLNAKNYFQTSKPEFKQNQFGGVVGGPVYIPKLVNGKDKAWFFFAFQELTNRNYVTYRVTVPTPAEKSGQFASPIRDPLTGQAFPNNAIPTSRFNSASQKLLGFWPDPNLSGPQNFISNSVANFNNPQIIARLDFKTSEGSKWWGRFLWDDSPLLGTSPFPIFSTETALSTWGVDISNSRAFGSSAINVATFHWFRRPDTLGVQNPELDPVAANLGIKGLVDIPINSTGVPGISVQGFQGFGGGVRGNVNVGNWEAKDDFSVQKGNHFLKMGGEYKRDYSFFIIALRGSFSFTNRYTGNPFADFLLGHVVNSSQGGDLQRGNNGQNNWYFYVQDDWKVSPKLTLNLGVRYELPLAWKDKRGFSTNFDLATGEFDPPPQNKVLLPFESGRFEPDLPLIEFPKTGVLPRIGLAYRISEKTVVRSGYGIYANLPDLNTGVGALNQNPRPNTFGKVFIADLTTPNISLSDPFPSELGVGPGGFPEAYGAESTMPLTRSHSWGLSIQHQLVPNLSFEIGYQGSHTTNQIESVSINDALPSPDPIQARRPYPDYSEIDFGFADGQAWYHGMEIKVDKRPTKEGLYFLGSYTWAKAIDTGQSRLSGNIAATGGSYVRSKNMPLSFNKGLSETHYGQRLSLTAGYELPFGPGKPFLQQGVGSHLLRGWSVQEITVFQDGYWFTVVIPGDPLNTGSSWSQRPDAIRSPNLSPSARTPQRWFDTAAFAAPVGFHYGNAGRGIVESPGIFNVDFSIHRNFRLTETHNLQFRFEAFNLLNHPNLGAPGFQFGTPSFGVIGTALSSRQLQFALKYSF